MPARIRSFVAALTVAALLGASVAPAAFADGFGTHDDTTAYASSVPIVFDVIILRPLGLLMTAGGAALYAFPVLPIVALTRPTQIWKPFGTLVATPARFTFSDPLGQHPVN